MFQLLSPKVDCSRATFRRDAHRKRPQSCPQGLKKWFITFTSPSTNQLPAWAWNHGVLWFCPAWSICNLHTIGSLFSWALLPVLLYGAIHNKIGHISPLHFSVSSVWLCRPWVDEPFLFGNTINPLVNIVPASPGTLFHLTFALPTPVSSKEKDWVSLGSHLKWENFSPAEGRF